MGMARKGKTECSVTKWNQAMKIWDCIHTKDGFRFTLKFGKWGNISFFLLPFMKLGWVKNVPVFHLEYNIFMSLYTPDKILTWTFPLASVNCCSSPVWYIQSLLPTLICYFHLTCNFSPVELGNLARECQVKTVSLSILPICLDKMMSVDWTLGERT